MNLIESLHNHTTLSDGKLSHQEFFELAQSLGLGVVAFTDHDALPDDAMLAYLESVRDKTTKWIIGIEISAEFPPEVGVTSGGDMHIIGLFVDPHNVLLVEHCRKAQSARVERMEHIVKNLVALGFRITAQDCLDASGGESVGRPHIVEALNKYPENKIVEESIRKEMEAASKNDPELAARYNVMMQKGEKQYPYDLYLSTGAFRSCYVAHRYMPTMDEAVMLIHGAGGVAFPAHYFTIKKHMPSTMVEQFLKEGRLDGMEVIYGASSIGTDKEQEILNERGALRALIERKQHLSSGGADAHTTSDLEYYAQNRALSEESIGMTQALLDSGRVNRRFSSL